MDNKTIRDVFERVKREDIHMHKFIKRHTEAENYAKSFVKWLLLGTLLGLLGGFVGGTFHECVELVAGVREKSPWLVWLLPVGGVVIALLYRTARTVLDTNLVIRAIHTSQPVNAVMLPLIYVSAVISHLFGASVGREGAALQIGGTLGYQCGKLLRMDPADRHLMVMAGMSAVFAANFGTPIAAALFSVEVATVGVMHYAGLVPCVVAAVSADFVASAMGVHAMRFAIPVLPALSAANFLRVAGLGIVCALVSIVFCLCLHRGEHFAQKKLPNAFMRVCVGGVVLAVLTWLVGDMRYNGAGGTGIAEAINGQAWWGDFLLKMAFTVISVSVGYKGGEIVPTMFIGATLGCVVGPLLGLDAGFAAAAGLLGLFCGMVNCPLATMVMGVEMFGGEAFPLFAVVCAVSYMLSGKYSLYKEQSLVYSKIKDDCDL